MPAFSLTPINSFPQTDGTEFPNPLAFSQDDVLFVGPITLVNFVGGTVTEDGNGTLDVTLGGGGGTTVPGNPTSSLQWNNAGAFGGTFGLAWSAELGSTQAKLTFQDLLIDPPNLSVWQPQRLEFFLDLIDRGQLYMSAVTIGTHIYSTVTYPPTDSVGTLDRPGIWVGGPYDNATPSLQCFDAWYLSDSIVFAWRDDQATYTRLQPLDTNQGTVLFPESYDASFLVNISGTTYKVPLIAA